METQHNQLPDDQHDFLPQDILVRTEKGNRESRIQTAESSLPRRLRTLLMVVDGKTPFHVYADTLANYGDVASLYEALETGGYITRLRRGHSAGDTSAEGNRADSPVQPAAPAAPPEPMKPRAVARPGMDDHDFRELITEISTLVESKLGVDAMEVLLKLETAGDPQQLLDMLPELGGDLEPLLGSRNTKKFISEIKKQLA